MTGKRLPGGSRTVSCIGNLCCTGPTCCNGLIRSCFGTPRVGTAFDHNRISLRGTPLCAPALCAGILWAQSICLAKSLARSNGSGHCDRSSPCPVPRPALTIFVSSRVNSVRQLLAEICHSKLSAGGPIENSRLRLARFIFFLLTTFFIGSTIILQTATVNTPHCIFVLNSFSILKTVGSEVI